MSGNNSQVPDFRIETDENGFPILPTENSTVLKKGSIKPKVQDDDFASDDDIEAAISGKVIQGSSDVEQASKPKLLKSGGSKTSEHVISPANTNKEEIIENKPVMAMAIDIEDTSIKHLIESAEKSKQSIKFTIEIDAIDVDLYKILNKSYKNKSDKIISLIIESNKGVINEKIIDSIRNHYEKPAENSH